jgi:CRISPR/Cas system CSM-associated protein Csm4 (group 5 of RAMP superfamily)
MKHDKISLLLQEIDKLKYRLKDLKKEIKKKEKLESEDYLNLKNTVKDLKNQLKDMEAEHIEKLAEDDDYQELRDLRLKNEEKLALKNQELFEIIDGLPSEPLRMDVDAESGRLHINILPEMALYLNGKPERKKF